MSEEPRRSGRATKGQHKHASSSPAPSAKPTKSTSKSKPPKKSMEPEPQEDDEDELIRCICGNDNPKDKRAFIGCDACTVWQHNVCMGIPDDEEETPEHYFCEECRPEEHWETIQAMQRGEKIWETRTRIYMNEKKMSKSRKSKGRGEDAKPAWLKKDPPTEEEGEEEEPAAAPASALESAVPETTAASNGGQEAGTKRKREDDAVKEEEKQPTPSDEKPTRSGRQDKRRKSSTIDTKILNDTDTALVSMEQLPKDRQKVAQTLSKVITEDIDKRVKDGLQLPGGQTSASIAVHHALRIEYGLHMNHGAAPGYRTQFMALNANLKKNTVLIERLLDGSLTADELSTMSSVDMASEELQRERAVMKEALDRQAIAVDAEGPKYKQDHKGFHLIEDSTQQSRTEPVQDPAAAKQPSPQENTGAQAQAGSPQGPLTIDTKPAETGHERRPSSANFDMNNIWAKTAQSPTAGPPTARPVQPPVRRQSSMQTQQNGTKDDADVDRLLDDNDDAYSPAGATGDDAIVWRGKLVQANEDDAPVVNARFVAGRDLHSTISWEKLLPQRLAIDGRLAITKAEEYLCGLRFSHTSDVSILALTPFDDAAAFEGVFNYFKSRERYAVVEKDKPAMVKDLYIIPLDVGAEQLPDHVGMLEHCTIKLPAEEKLLLATFVVARSPDSPSVMQDGTPSHQPTNGHIPPHVRQSIGGPAGSPITSQNPTFSPANSAPPQSPYGQPPGTNTFPPNPYGPQTQAPQQQQQAYPLPQHQPAQYPPPPGMVASTNPLVNEILGELQYASTAQLILTQAPTLSKDQLVNLRTILTEDQNAREDFAALTAKLYM